MRHKWSWTGQDDIQLNLEEKEELGLFFLCLYLCNYLLWMS